MATPLLWPEYSEKRSSLEIDGFRSDILTIPSLNLAVKLRKFKPTMYEENESLLVTQAHNGVPILVPWGHQALIPGTGFKSENIMGHPWMDQSAFTPFDPQAPYIKYESQGDRRAYFRSAESDSHGVSTQHYSGSLGATVDLTFAKVNVTGSYDKDIKENKDVRHLFPERFLRFFH